MVHVMARREARPCERWPTSLKGEFENNSRKSRDLTENWHSDSLKKCKFTHSQGKMKKGDAVADDDNDDVVRASVSQNE
jgi:hypothetical protein